MKPYYQDSSATIYHGDCRTILPTLGKADLVLTDPPYGLGDKWTGGTWGSDPMYSDAKKWDRALPDGVIESVIEKGKNAIVWGGNYFMLPPCRGFLLWIKTPAMETMADSEFAWTTYDFVSKSYLSHRNPDGKRQHPTQKPLNLILWCIHYAYFRSEVKTILDPFMGSGTTLVAAKQLGRKSIGIELEEKYCEAAARRLQQEYLPLNTETVSTLQDCGDLFPSSQPPSASKP